VTLPAPWRKQRGSPRSPRAPGSPVAVKKIHDIWDPKLVNKLISTMFIAPVLNEPGMTTLVLGMWGIHEIAGALEKVEKIGQMLGDAILGYRAFNAMSDDQMERSHAGRSLPGVTRPSVRGKSTQRSMSGEHSTDSIKRCQSGIVIRKKPEARDIDDPNIVCLGQLYHEIHFALPYSNDEEKNVVDCFQRGLAKAGLKPSRIPALDAST